MRSYEFSETKLNFTISKIFKKCQAYIFLFNKLDFSYFFSIGPLSQESARQKAIIQERIKKIRERAKSGQAGKKAEFNRQTSDLGEICIIFK